MTKIETGKFYRFSNGTIAQVVAQGFDRVSGWWVRYETMDGKSGDAQLNDALNGWGKV